MVDTINEDTTSYLTVAFLDKTGTAATPTAVSYRVDCLSNGREVRDWTVWGGTLDDTIEIELTPADSAILSPSNETETRRVQVVATFSSGQYHGEFEYLVDNLREPIVPIIVIGDDYNDTDGRAFKFTGGLGWPALDGSGASVLFTAVSNSVDTEISKTGTIEVSTGSSKIVRVELTAAETAALEPSTRYKYKLTATLTTGGRVVTLTSGALSVVER